MNVAQARPRRWSPQVILFAVALHAVILYYVAATFHIVPSIIEASYEPPTIPTITLPPPLPILPPEPIKQHPHVIPRQPAQPPIAIPIPPIPLPPQQPAASTADAGVMTLNAPIPEEPVSRALPPYPRMALESGKEGQVVLSITIMPDGSVRDVQILSAQPRGYFESAAQRSVSTWRYKPSNVIRTRVIVHMDFELKG